MHYSAVHGSSKWALFCILHVISHIITVEISEMQQNLLNSEVPPTAIIHKLLLKLWKDLTEVASSSGIMKVNEENKQNLHSKLIHCYNGIIEAVLSGTFQRTPAVSKVKSKYMDWLFPLTWYIKQFRPSGTEELLLIS